MTYYTLKEIEDEINKIKKDDKYIEINEIQDKKQRNYIYSLIQRDLNLLTNEIHYNLLNFYNQLNIKYNYIDFFDDIEIVIYPVIEIITNEINDNHYYYNLYQSIFYYQYKQYCFKNIEDLKQYIINELSLNRNINYCISIDEDDINKIFDYIDEDFNDIIDKICFYDIDNVYNEISNYKIEIKDDININLIVTNDKKEILNKIFDDLFNNFIYHLKIKELINYKDFKIIFDQRLLNYINDDFIYDNVFEDIIFNNNVDEIKDYILKDVIKYHYDNYLNRYYDIKKFFNFKIEVYDLYDDKIKLFDEVNDDLINFIKE